MLFQLHGRAGFWRMPSERLLLECIVPAVKFGGGGGVVSFGVFYMVLPATIACCS